MPSTTSFEISGFPPGTVAGTCELFETASGGFAEIPSVGSGLSSNNLLQSDQDLIVRVKWDELGPFAPFLNGGQWRIEAIAEQVGGSATNQAATQISSGGGSYVQNLTFSGLSVGLYRILVSTQWFFPPTFANGGPIAGFCELGVIRVFQEP